ncbi:MAG: hydrogenase maturation protease [Myxococcaceae bacterium]|nr:hydrogenase maturation protease [Myxococcaceae bacterium]
MTARILVAGVGNVFLGDDGFGVEVARRLLCDPPPGAQVVDYGIRGLHLAYALLEGCDLLIAVDAMPRGQPPGTLYVLEPGEVDALPPIAAEGHGMNLPAVFALVRQLGGTLPRIRIVGCEPASVDERMGLGEEVAAVVPQAESLVRRLVEAHRES